MKNHPACCVSNLTLGLAEIKAQILCGDKRLFASMEKLQVALGNSNWRSVPGLRRPTPADQIGIHGVKYIFDLDHFNKAAPPEMKKRFFGVAIALSPNFPPPRPQLVK